MKSNSHGSPSVHSTWSRHSRSPSQSLPSASSIGVHSQRRPRDVLLPVVLPTAIVLAACSLADVGVAASRRNTVQFHSLRTPPQTHLAATPRLATRGAHSVRHGTYDRRPRSA